MARFLEIVTRYFLRPALLAKNKASLAAQTDDDWQQTLLIDSIGRGINWASENLGMYAPNLVGQYIWLLDDDDECIRPTLVAELKQIVAEHQPDVIMLKMDHGPRGILPDADTWQQPPVHGYIGCSAYVVSRELWLRHCMAWLPGEYHSDFNFIATVFAHQPLVYWHDVVASRVQQIGLGRPERNGTGMKVKAKVSFVGYDLKGTKHRIELGQEFDLPLGVDWLDKGLVMPVQAEEKPAKKSKAA
jgi:glycosyltransferase involved in cell wall biosynthesis